VSHAALVEDGIHLLGLRAAKSENEWPLALMKPRYFTTVVFAMRIILARDERDGILSGICNAASRLILETAILGAPMLFP